MGLNWNPIHDAEEIGKDGAKVATDGVHVAGDVLNTDVTEGKDILQTGAKVTGDVLRSGANAAEDYGHGWSRAFHDAFDGNPLDALKAPLDVAEGGLKSLADLGEGGVHVLDDGLKGGLTLAADGAKGALHTAEDLGKGALHVLGFGGSSALDKTIEKALVGQEDPALLKANDAEEKRGKATLAEIKQQLAGQDPGAFGTADQLLDPGSAGMHFFDYFIPPYNAWTGASVSIDTIRQAYDRERGMSFSAYTADSKLMTAAAGGTADITASLNSAYDTLVPTWQGPAASNFETAMSTYFGADKSVADTLTTAGKNLSALVVALQTLVYTKASTVSGLYVDTLEPGIDGHQALTVVAVAKNSGIHDPQRRWVLGTFGQPIHGRHAWDSDSMYSLDDLDDRSRDLAQEVAAQWCNAVLDAQFEQRLNLFDQTCDTTTQQIQQLFAQFDSDVTAVKDPFAGMPTTLPSGADPDGSGGAGGDGGESGAGGSGGAGSTGSPGTGDPGVAVGGGETVPTGTGDPGVAVGGGETVVTGPATGPDPITTNPNGSVTFGPAGTFTIGTENPDGSFDLTETDSTGTHTYQVTFGPNGRPIITPEDPTGSDASPVDPTAVDPVTTDPTTTDPTSDPSATADPIVTNTDGSVSLGPDGDVTIGTDASGQGFTLTQTIGGAPHDYQVTYDASGHPHVTDLDSGDGGLAVTPNQSVAPASITPTTDSGTGLGTGIGADTGAGIGGGGPGGSGSDFGSGGGGAGVGGAGVDAGSGVAAPATVGTTSTQMGVGTQFGAADPTGAAAVASLPPAVAMTATGGAAASGGGSGVAGMPMMGMGGMGRGGAGGGEQELKRRYGSPPGGLIDDDELEEWDRLGPTIG